MIINLGEDTTRNILAGIDTPILQGVPAVMYGLCSDDSFSCGYDRAFESYLSNHLTRNISRYAGEGGVMYFENVHLMRVHLPGIFTTPMKFLRLVFSDIIDVCRDHSIQARHSEINYLTTNGKKAIGAAWIHENDANFSSLIISFNLRPFNFDAIKGAYKIKNLSRLGDLSGVSDSFLDDVSHKIAARFNIPDDGAIDLKISNRLREIHHSSEWILNGKRWW